MVQLDPEGWLLAEIDFQKPVQEWAIEVAEARQVMGRVAAAEALADIPGDLEALEALGRALTSDPSRHVRAAAAAGLGEIGTEGALRALEAGLDDPDARVRRDVARALGSFRSEHAGRLATRLIDKDPSPYVVGDAAEALGKTEIEGALSRLVKVARRESHDEAIQRGAYAGMAALEQAEAIPHLLRATRYGTPWRARGKAIESLGKLAKVLPEERAEIRRRLLELIGDRHFDARRSAVAALGESEDGEVLPHLRQLARTSREPGVRHSAREAVWSIVNAQKASDSGLAKRIDEVEREGRQLREDLERLRERVPGADHATERR
jgi:aminopeptidase N